MKKLLIAPIAGSLFFAACSEKKEESALPDHRDAQIADLELQVQSLKDEAAEERESFRAQSAASTAMMSQLKDMLMSMREQKDEPIVTAGPIAEKASGQKAEAERKAEAEHQMILQKQLLDQIRQERLLAKGEEHSTMVTERGDIFWDVVIREVSDIGISIRHRGGAGRIAFEDLPKSWRERFGYDPVRSARALERENLVQAKYAMAASKELSDQREQNEKLQRELREAQLALEVARASQPINTSIMIEDPATSIVPLSSSVVYEEYYDNYYNRPILHVPKLKVPILGGNGAYCPPPSKPGHRPQVPGPSRPPVSVPSRPTPTRPSTVRPPASSSSVSRPSVSVPSRPSVSRPSVSRPSVSAPSRPSVSAPSRPSVSRPSVSAPSRPSVSRPSVSAPSRPSVSRPSMRQAR